MKTGTIYARYSSNNQTEQSIEGQIRVCREFAQRNGIVIVGTYIDRATTGTNDNREQFQKMLKDSDKKSFDYVLVLIQVGGGAAEGGCAALGTLGASRLGRRDKHTPPQPKQSVNSLGLPKKICIAKIFWEEGENRIMRISTVCCARASN